MKVIAYEKQDGGIVIVYPAADVSLELVWKKDVPEDASAVELDINQVPQDRYFRDAWALKKKQIGVDLVKARAIHLDVLRLRRAEKLQQLDIEWMKLTGQKKVTEADAVEATRQALRDMPDTISSQLQKAKTPEDIKALIPDELK